MANHDHALHTTKGARVETTRAPQMIYSSYVAFYPASTETKMCCYEPQASQDSGSVSEQIISFLFCSSMLGVSAAFAA